MSQEIFLLIVIFSMMAVTFAIRLIPLHLSPERTPRFINAVIEYIPAAVISSITIPALFFPQNAGFSLYNASPVTQRSAHHIRGQKRSGKMPQMQIAVRRWRGDRHNIFRHRELS